MARTQHGVRSRFGCETCKSRHIKCDEARPACENCRSKHKSCSYAIHLQYREDLEKKQKAFGREGIWTKKRKLLSLSKVEKPPKQNVYVSFTKLTDPRFLNFFQADFENVSSDKRLIYQDDVDTYEFIQLDLGRMDTIFDSSLYHSNPTLNYIDTQESWSYPLAYYIENVSIVLNPINIFKLGQTSNSNIKFHDGLDSSNLLRYSQHHSHVKYLLLGLSSLCLSNMSNLSSEAKTIWQKESQKLRNMGLTSLKSVITNIDLQCPGNIRVDIFISLLLVTLHDLVNNCNNNWSNQLQLCNYFLNIYRGSINILDSVEASLFTYAVDFFAYQESMSRTACNKSNVFNKHFSLLPSNGVFNSEAEVTIIPWMGCDKRLLELISDITDLSFERFTNKGNFLLLANGIKEALLALKMPSEFSELCSQSEDTSTTLGTLDTEELCLYLNCEVKRLTALIYCECSLFNKYPSHGDILSLFHNILKHLKFIIMKNKYKWSSMTWSLYILASQLNLSDPESESIKLTILDMLNNIQNIGFGTIGKVENAIISIWKKRELRGYEIMLQPGDNSRKNDWEAFIVDQRHTLSLG